MSRAWVTISNVSVIRQTSMAGLFRIADEEVWIPWSQVSEDCELQSDGDEGELIVSEYLAIKKGLEWDKEIEDSDEEEQE